jgi:hypothetical protein
MGGRGKSMTAIGQGVVVQAGEARRVGAARWIGIFAPGRYEQLVEELGAILPHNAPPDETAVTALFAKWDTEIVVQAGS